MAQNLRNEQQAAKDWAVDRLQKMDRVVFSRLQAAAQQCAQRGARPTLLTIGEGSGADAQKIYVERLNAQVTAVDAAPTMQTFAGSHYSEKDIAFIQDSWPKLSKLGSQPFDIVISNRVLQEIKPEEQMAAIKRALELSKPGGEIIIIYQAKKTREGQFTVDERALAAGLEQLNAQRNTAHPYQFAFWKSDATGELAAALDGSAREEHVLHITMPRAHAISPDTQWRKNTSASLRGGNSGLPGH